MDVYRRAAVSPAALEKLFNAPAGNPPPGVERHLDTAKNYNKEANAFMAVCLVLTTFALAARIYSRLAITKKLHLEDYFGMIAYLPFVVLCWTIVDYGNYVGYFVHQWDLRGRINVRHSMLTFIITICYCLLMFFLKAAILLEWQRIFALNRTNSVYFWVSMTLIILNSGLWTSALLSSIFMCNPIEKVFKFWLEGTCINRQTRDIFNAGANLVLDLFIFLLPQRVIWRLNLNKNRRIGLSVVFSVGLITIGLASGRLYATIKQDYTTSDMSKPSDRTYKFSKLTLWAFGEIVCIFLVFCVPALPKLFTENSVISRFLVSMRSWTGMGSSRRNSPPNSGQNKSGTWPRTIGSWSAGRSRYRRAEDELGTTDSSTELATIKEQGKAGHIEHSHGIMKTLEVDYQVDAASARSVDPELGKQHPWMNA